MEEVKKGNKILSSLVRSVKRHDERLKALETELKKNSSPSSGTPGSTPKRSRRSEVPDEVRVRMGYVYNSRYALTFH